MQIATLSTTLHHPDQALLFDLDELYAVLRQIKDQRGKQGRHYPLAEILLIGILAKLAGQTSSRAMADWAKLRSQDLQQLFRLRHEKMPHYSTWSRIMGQAIEPEELEQALGRFFARQWRTATQPGERHLCVDGKTLKGTIPLGKTQGVHLLAAYLPQEGVVLAQMQVKTVGNEISEAPTLLSTIDWRGTVVSGDANFAASAFSQAILKAKGDDLWVIKENRGEMDRELHLLFEPQKSRPGWSAPPMDFRRATSEGQSHGRRETRQITVSSLLASYSLWPGLSQVFKLEPSRTNALGQIEQETAYGISSLPHSTATPQRLLELVREHWQSENGLQYRRDRSFREDDSQLRMGHAPHVLATLNNTAWGVFARHGQTNLPHAQRTFAYQFDRALARLASS